MTSVRITLLSDGSSDRALLPVIRWLLRRYGWTAPIQEAWADLRRLRPVPERLAARIETALDLYPCDVLFVHRDAENEDPGVRLREIETAAPPTHRWIPVIPVRMTEAWLLFDEALIRAAAGNPQGTMPLELPQLSRLESLPDPKSVLFSLLKQASGLQGRRLNRLNLPAARLRVADLAEGFGPLFRLDSFRVFAEDIQSFVTQIGTDLGGT